MSSMSVNDLFLAWLQTQLPAGVVAGTAQPTPGAGTLQQTSESLNAYGSVTNPGIDGEIVKHTTPPAGLYDVYIKYGLTGSGPVAADINNFTVKRGVTVIISTAAGTGRLLNPSNVPTNASDFPSVTMRVRLDGTQDISVRTVVAAGAATVAYNAVLIITRRGD